VSIFMGGDSIRPHGILKEHYLISVDLSLLVNEMESVLCY